LSQGLSDEDGVLAVKAAREAMEAHVERREPEVELTPHFQRKGGAFVTIHDHPRNTLRGCIGFPEPMFTLGESILRAGAAVCEDPRFPPLKREETDTVIVEVSVLSVPEPIEAMPEELPAAIEIGRDGLILEKGHARGLLLPQVPVEWGWDAEEYLRNLSRKAGLDPEGWRNATIHRFQSAIFTELEPRGDIVRRGGH